MIVNADGNQENYERINWQRRIETLRRTGHKKNNYWSKETNMGI